MGYQPPKEKKPDPVLSTLAELFRKMYNPRNFKGLVSPHEFYQAIGKATSKKFYAKQQDPVAFFSWLMGYLHRKLRGREGSSMLFDVFQGEVQVKLCSATDEARVTETKEKTLLLTLQLPDEPFLRTTWTSSRRCLSSTSLRSSTVRNLSKQLPRVVSRERSGGTVSAASHHTLSSLSSASATTISSLRRIQLL